MARLDKNTVEIIKKALNHEINRPYRADIKRGLEFAIEIIDYENEGGK